MYSLRVYFLFQCRERSCKNVAFLLLGKVYMDFGVEFVKEASIIKNFHLSVAFDNTDKN